MNNFIRMLSENVLSEAANYIPFAKKMSEEDFNLVRDTDPKKLEWIVNAYLKLSPEDKEWFKENTKLISDDLASWYNIANQQKYIRDGYIKSKDLKTELIASNVAGENDFLKLHSLINKLTAGVEGF